MGRIELISVIINALLLVTTIALIRTRRLRLKYSLLWLFTFTVMIILSFLRHQLDAASLVIGIYYSPSFLFIVAFLFLLIIVLYYSLEITRLSETNKTLIQKMSIALHRIEELEKRAVLFKTK